MWSRQLRIRVLFHLTLRKAAACTALGLGMCSNC
jgi:hypothetical protein